MSKLKILIMVAAFSAAMLGGSAIASADEPDGPVEPGDADAFLCPVVGDGVSNADAIDSFAIASGTSFLPGNNQAGAHADSSSYSSEGPGTSDGPGDPDYTPIWPG